MSLMERSARALLDEFAASTPTPGGGSAAALAGAIGASLLRMVAAMPKTRTGAPDERASLDGTLEPLDAARARLAALVDEDTAAYDGVMAAFKLPKATDEEKAARRLAIQRATRVATDTPLEVMRTAARALGAAAIVSRHGNGNAASDVKVGVSLLLSACEGAHENVTINVPGLAEGERSGVEAEAATVRADAEGLAREARAAL